MISTWNLEFGSWNLVLGSLISFDRVGDDLLGFGNDPGEVVRATEAFGVDFVDVLGAGGTGGEPAVGGGDFQAADRGVVAWRLRELDGDALAGHFGSPDGVGREAAELLFLLRR